MWVGRISGLEFGWLWVGRISGLEFGWLWVGKIKRRGDSVVWQVQIEWVLLRFQVYIGDGFFGFSSALQKIHDSTPLPISLSWRSVEEP